jgi:hypothetical protein
MWTSLSLLACLSPHSSPTTLLIARQHFKISAEGLLLRVYSKSIFPAWEEIVSSRDNLNTARGIVLASWWLVNISSRDQPLLKTSPVSHRSNAPSRQEHENLLSSLHPTSLLPYGSPSTEIFRMFRLYWGVDSV